MDAIESYSDKVDAFDDSHTNVQLEVIRDEIKYSVETAKEKGEGEFKFGNEDKTTCFSMANPWATMMYKNN